MPQGNGSRKRDNSPEANNVRQAVAAQRAAREVLKDAGGISPFGTSRLKGELRKTDDAAYKAAMAYRKSRQRKS